MSVRQPRTVSYGNRGYDVTAYARALNRARADKRNQAGPNWPKLRVAPVFPHYYGDAMAMAVKAFKARYPWDAAAVRERGIGAATFPLLHPYIDAWGEKLLGLWHPEPACPSNPLRGHGTIIGVPYEGTHSHPSPSDPMHNWESCNAVDLAVPVGTPCYAVCAGTIGSQIGPLGSSDPVLLGLRLHLVRADGGQEWYLAHLSRLAVHAGERVKTGQLLGLTGSANGVAHLHLAQRRGDPGVVVDHPTPGYIDHGYPG